ncbi:hypothetical protein CBL_05287 [Carabus blaptoides fortunei]
MLPPLLSFYTLFRGRPLPTEHEYFSNVSFAERPRDSVHGAGPEFPGSTGSVHGGPCGATEPREDSEFAATIDAALILRPVMNVNTASCGQDRALSGPLIAWFVSPPPPSLCGRSLN